VALSQEDVEKLEASFTKYEDKEPVSFPVMVDKDHGVVILLICVLGRFYTFPQADFNKMVWTSGKKDYNLRRTFYEGLWAQVSLSKTETKLSARIGTIQACQHLLYVYGLVYKLYLAGQSIV